MSNQQKPLVSIIVPVYNVESYLDRCLESLVAQTLEEIEIILVDDGSTDGSPALCDAWTQKDSRIRVIHKENGGLSDARNAGVQLATADWVGYVDSDDYVSPDMYKILYDNLKNDGASVSMCGICSVYGKRTFTPEVERRFVASGTEVLKELLIGDDLIVGIPPKLYSRQIMIETPFPVGRTYEDAFVVADIFTRAQTVTVDLKPLYYYWHRQGTITTRPYTRASLDVIEAYRHAYDVVMEKCPELEQEARFRLYWAHFVVLDKMLLTVGVNKCDEQDEVVRFLRRNMRGILASPYVGKGRKIAMCALKMSPRLYKPFAAANARHYEVKES